MTTAHDLVVEPAPRRTSRRALPPLALMPIAALMWWVVGFLPWILDGASYKAFGIPTVALPLFAGHLSMLVLGAGVGGIAAGLTARLGAGHQAVRVGACTAGVAMALVVALVQSRSGINGDVDDGRVTNGLTVIVVLVTLIGLALGLLSLTGRVALGFSLGALAGAAPVWLMSVLMAGGVPNAGAMENADELSRWVGAAVLAAALVVVELRPPVRPVAWPGIVLLAWFIAPAITAAAYAQVFLRPGMGSPDLWSDHVSATIEVWRQAASMDMRPLTPWIVAVAVAGATSLWLANRPRARSDEPEPSAST